jgi:hypothetical protein
MTNELGRTWKAAAVVYFKVLYQHVPVEVESNHENPAL